MSLEKLVPKLIRASLDEDYREVRSLSMRVIRRLKESHPKIAEEIADALSEHGIGASTKRAVGISDSPVDMETLQSLCKVEEPIDIDYPIFSPRVNELVKNFIREREESKKLFSVGLTPPTSLLLYGQPGVGKTELAKYLSGILNLNLITLDLASAISSYLGKTGQNLKKVLDYAKSSPSILLLDEFDAVAKRRDDMSDLGELKRIVNVLLKELEDWPPNTVVIAATNHPDLLDTAIWRRFDRAIEIGLPEQEERIRILTNQLEDKIFDKVSKSFVTLIAEMTKGLSGADLCKLVERTKRKAIIYDINVMDALIKELVDFKGCDSVEFNKKFCRLAKTHMKVSIRKLAEWLDKSPSAIQYYLKEKGEEVNG
ncbi:AAA family ATPase [Priestia aryabhattai]|uniref:AAA family ATPase n=1 Tax=Priestia aryabhattai TaxID=412384 RepID=UPI0027E44AB8|nr:ATP-binding protein [Priestia aryabhattai]MCG0050790.1 ATP-binding protein [Priestia aryabhattai]